MIEEDSPCSTSHPATVSDIVLYPSLPPPLPPEIYTPQPSSTIVVSEAPDQLLPISNYPQKPRKKRTKLTRLQIPTPSSSSSSFPSTSKPKYTKKPDPAAPKITRPCSECGKKFWSWKALFGHMRCHPERQWRGINPPPNFNRHDTAPPETSLTEEDHDIAACLLMLANSPTTSGGADSPASCRFECSSCKKVFGSHQALGGHRATHKNVKGCFAITRCDGEEIDNVGGGGNLEERGGGGGGGDGEVSMVFGHQCSICLRVFSSGQALGGHKRCHWEKIDEPLMSQQGLIDHNPGGGLDLNMPAPVEDETLHPSCSANSGLVLDLRLGL